MECINNLLLIYIHPFFSQRKSVSVRPFRNIQQKRSCQNSSATVISCLVTIQKFDNYKQSTHRKQAPISPMQNDSSTAAPATGQSHPSQKKRILAWGRRILGVPPDLPPEYTQAEYARFMREETFSYTKRYACRRVMIHGGHHLVEATRRGGALLAFLHYGSFFLSGGAVVHQLGLPYTAVVTNRNFQCLAPEEAAFWRGVQHRASTLYGQPLFLTGSPPREMLTWLTAPTRLLGVALDVREQGVKIREYPFIFHGARIMMQIGPARLARLAGASIIPMTIQYHPLEKRHHLYFDAPLSSTDDPFAVTQRLLDQLGRRVSQAPQQMFHDIGAAFAAP
jgi:hypothetical protein